MASGAKTEPLIQNGFMKITRQGKVLRVTAEQNRREMTAEIDLPEEIRSCSSNPCADPLWGAGSQLSVRHGNRLTTLTLYKGNPFLHLETRLSNPTNAEQQFDRLTIAGMTLDLGLDAGRLNTLGTAGLRPADNPAGSYAYSVLADPESRAGFLCAWLTQRRGVGLMLPSFEEGRHYLETQLDFGSMHLMPGQTRDTDILLIGFFSDARLGLERYADHVASVYDIHLPPKPEVYCTWYHRNLTGSGASTEEMLAENAAFAKETLQPFGLDVFQIDDHWQALEGEGEKRNKGPVKTFMNSNEYFPGGMAQTAAMLKKKGFVPGIWFMPFAGDLNNPVFDPAIFARDKTTGGPFEDNRWSGTSIDSSSPQGESFLRERFRRIHDWGYRYIKIDGLHIGTPSHNIYVNRSFDGTTFADAEIHDKNLTFIEAYRKGMRMLREAFPDTFILGCAAPQNMVSFAPMFGMVDAMRVGSDNDAAGRGKWQGVIKGADYAGNLWFLHNRVWYNDPDPFYVRESNPLDKARWMASWLAVSGAMNTTSMQYAELPPERLDLIKRTLPAHDLNARPVDVLENRYPQIWKVENDRMAVVALLNWDEENKTVIDYPLDRLGLDSGKSYEAFEFWGNNYLGTVTGRLVSTLQGAQCRVIALRESAGHPQLLSTSRHITQGLIEVIREEWTGQKLAGTSRVVAGDPYEMRIVCPEGFRAEKVIVSDRDADISGIEQKEGLARVVVTPKTTGSMDWEIIF